MHIFASLCLLVLNPLYGMKDKTLIKLMAVFVIAAVGMQGVLAMPWQFYFANPSQDAEFPGVNNETLATMQAFYEQVQSAVEAGDYGAWKGSMESLITEENFQRHVDFHNQMRERHDLMEQMSLAWEDGDYETIQELRGQLSESGMMPVPNGRGKGLMESGQASSGLGNAWGRVKEAVGKLAFWRQ